MRGDLWTPEHDDTLIELMLSGLSSAVIGSVMGRTKGSIIGRLHRLGYQKPRPAPKPKAKRRSRAKAKAAPVKVAKPKPVQPKRSRSVFIWKRPISKPLPGRLAEGHSGAATMSANRAPITLPRTPIADGLAGKWNLTDADERAGRAASARLYALARRHAKASSEGRPE